MPREQALRVCENWYQASYRGEDCKLGFGLTRSSSNRAASLFITRITKMRKILAAVRVLTHSPSKTYPALICAHESIVPHCWTVQLKPRSLRWHWRGIKSSDNYHVLFKRDTKENPKGETQGEAIVWRSAHDSHGLGTHDSHSLRANETNGSNPGHDCCLR